MCGASSVRERVEAPNVSSLDEALWYERSTLEALLAALCRSPASDPPDDELWPLLQERRMARLLRVVETTAVTEQLGLPPGSPGIAHALGGGWATVLDEHDVALQRLAHQVDAAVESRRGR